MLQEPKYIVPSAAITGALYKQSLLTCGNKEGRTQQLTSGPPLDNKHGRVLLGSTRDSQHGSSGAQDGGGHGAERQRTFVLARVMTFMDTGPAHGDRPVWNSSWRRLGQEQSGPTSPWLGPTSAESVSSRRLQGEALQHTASANSATPQHQVHSILPATL
jgi:hypothetical protein